MNLALRREDMAGLVSNQGEERLRVFGLDFTSAPTAIGSKGRRPKHLTLVVARLDGATLRVDDFRVLNGPRPGATAGNGCPAAAPEIGTAAEGAAQRPALPGCKTPTAAASPAAGGPCCAPAWQHQHVLTAKRCSLLPGATPQHVAGHETCVTTGTHLLTLLRRRRVT